jgi:serine/threonine protein kinase
MIQTPVALTAAGATWQAAPELIARGVLGPDGPRLAEWLATGEAVVIKQAPHCTVYRVVLPGLDFHLKHYHPADARARARSLLRASKASSEAERTREAGSRGVPTLEPLAVGESPEGSFLLTRTVRDAQTVTAFLEEELPRLDARRQARVRQRLATALGRFLARMHDAGVVHDDLHPGNLLLRLGADDEVELYLIDLYAVRLGPPLDWPRSRDNLVILNRWFVLRSARSDRLRCWLAYRQARTWRAGSRKRPELDSAISPRRNDVKARKTIRNLENSTLLSNLQFWRAKDHRCLGGNRWFRRVRSAVAAGSAAADMDLAVLAPLLADPDEPFRRPGVVVLKDSPSSTVIEFDLPVGGASRRVIYKRFAVTRWTDPWAALFRPAPALRSYVMGHGMRLRGLPTPRPLAVWHRKRFGLFHEGYLLTEKAANAVELPDYVTDLDRLPPAERRAALRGLIDQAARLLAALHARRLSHRDLKGANLLVNAVPWFVSSRGAVERSEAASETSPRPQIWFIDLVGVRRHDRLTGARRAQNLARLYASFHGRGLITRTDLLRFLHAYLGLGWAGASSWRAWYVAVARAFQAKVRRNLRNGRPLG